jgi:hypothetical protein
MAVTYSIATKTARLQAVVNQIDAGSGPGTLEIGTAAMALVLATITLADPCGTVSGDTLTFDFDPDVSDPSADATGTAVAARIKDSNGNTVEIPRKSLDDHLIYFGSALLKHMESPKWIIRGYQSAKGFEIKFCGDSIAPIMGVCSSFLKNPGSYLNEKQLEDWEITIFGPDHNIGANIFDFVERGKEALDEQGRLHGRHNSSLASLIVDQPGT